MVVELHGCCGIACEPKAACCGYLTPQDEPGHGPLASGLLGASMGTRNKQIRHMWQLYCMLDRQGVQHRHPMPWLVWSHKYAFCLLISDFPDDLAHAVEWAIDVDQQLAPISVAQGCSMASVPLDSGQRYME